MQQISGPDTARVVLSTPDFVVPPVPPGSAGAAWLRASVGRFATGEAHQRRRGLSIGVLSEIALDYLRAGGRDHPVDILAQAMGLDRPVGDLVSEVTPTYLPGTGTSQERQCADVAVERLVAVCGGDHSELTAARIGVLVQACHASNVLIERSRRRPLEEVLRMDPPVRTTQRQALIRTSVGGFMIEAGEVVQVHLGGGLAFGAGPRRCPGRQHALALVEGALA